VSLFKRRRFPVKIILLCVRWYCKYGIIPSLGDQNPCAQSRRPIDMMVHGCSVSLFHAAQQ
jgi:hypothetical protein